MNWFLIVIALVLVIAVTLIVIFRPKGETFSLTDAWQKVKDTASDVRNLFVASPPPPVKIPSGKGKIVVVIGSGYGGSVIACRMAQAGARVAVIERGKRWKPEEFPRDIGDGIQNVNYTFTTTTPKPMMFHLGFNVGAASYPFSYWYEDGLDSKAITISGVGGGSLGNAGVFWNPDAAAISDLPAPWRTKWSVNYNKAKTISAPEIQMSVHPRTSEFYSLITNGYGEKTEPLMITSDLSQSAGINNNCVLGCASKKSLDKTYLKLAEQSGATINEKNEVLYLKKSGSGWHVHLKSGQTIWADVVVVSAGVFGSTKILSQSRDVGGVSISSRLGENVSGNGDDMFLVTDAKNVGHNQSFPQGPPISAGFKIKGNRDEWVLYENLYPPDILMGVLQILAFRSAGDFALKMSQYMLHSYKPYRVFLTMNKDANDGEIKWDKNGKLIRYRDATDYQSPSKLKATQHFAQVLGGRADKQHLDRIITTHPLGGCVASSSSLTGVVNLNCQVFTGKNETEAYLNLYVCDGSVITGLGVNPFSTILTVAEICAETMVKTHGK